MVIRYTSRMEKDQMDHQRFDQLVRKALATPPISNEEIERRSKERRGKR
jgi:hypothetical protein